MSEHRIKFDRPTEPPSPPPLTRPQGGIVRLPEIANAAALDNLADAIRELARAIASRNPSPPEAVPPDTASPGPAKGLTTQIRPTPDHRNPNHDSNFGFAPVKAEGHSQAPVPYQHHNGGEQ